MSDRVEVDKRVRLLDDFFKVDEAYLRYERFDGQMSPTMRRLVFERGDSVAAVVIHTDLRQVILVEQFLYPAYGKSAGWLTTLPAGILETGEEPESAIRRELLEETGYQATYVEDIATFFVSPGGTSERIFLYYAETDDANHLASGGGVKSENEDIRLVQIPLPQVWQALDSGKYADAKTLIGLMWLRRRLEEDPQNKDEEA